MWCREAIESFIAFIILWRFCTVDVAVVQPLTLQVEDRFVAYVDGQVWAGVADDCDFDDAWIGDADFLDELTFLVGLGELALFSLVAHKRDQHRNVDRGCNCPANPLAVLGTSRRDECSEPVTEFAEEPCRSGSDDCEAAV